MGVPVDLLGLFVAALVAATLLPMGSEVVLYTLAQQGAHSLWLLWGVATVGNTLGSVINWALGRYLMAHQHKRWFTFNTSKLPQWQAWFNRFGVWSLLLAWLPVVGDPLTFVAGVFKVRLPVFVTLVALGKGLRYAVVLGLPSVM